MSASSMQSVAVSLFLVFVPINSSVSGDASTPAAQAKHGLTGSYYVRSPAWPAVPEQVSMDPNDFQLPRPLTAPAAVRVDPQIAFGKGKAFVMKGEEQQTIWWPTGYAMPPGWTGVARFDMKPWDPNLFAAVIWKGYVHLPKAGTYYFATVSRGPAAVYLGQARVALADNGVVVSDAFSYAKEDIQDFVQWALSGRWDGVGSRHDAMYVVPVTIDRPRDLPFEVRHSSPRAFRPIGIDLFWVTPDSPRDASGKPVAQIVPSEVLYTEPPAPIEKPAVRSANSMLGADFLYFPAERTDKDVTVTVQLRDKDGRPVAGKRVHVSSLVSKGPADVIVQPEKLTDEKGETTARIRAGAGDAYKVTHDSTIFATDVTDFVDVAQMARVTFEAGTVPATFFGDVFARYYDPGRIHVEPLPLIQGRPVTISAKLENRGKFPAELAATFTFNDWNIGATDWKNIGKTEKILLKPGESRVISVKWTPKATTGHLCFRVELTGRVLFAANGSNMGAIAAALVPSTRLAHAAAPDGGSIKENLQSNIGPVTPPPPCTPGLLPAVSDGKTVDPLSQVSLLGSLLDRPCTPSQEWKDYAKRQFDYFTKAFGPDCEAMQRDRDYAHARRLYIVASILGWKLYFLCYDAWAKMNDFQTLYNDPPDRNFQRLVIADSDTPTGYLEAWRRSWERYQGAQAVGDVAWMAKHLTATQLYIRSLRRTFHSDANALRQEAEQLSPDNEDATTGSQKDDPLEEWLRQGARLTPNQIQKLQGAGFSEQEARQLITEFRAQKGQFTIKRKRTLALNLAALDQRAADELEKLEIDPTASDQADKVGQPLVQAYTVGNPHDKEEKVDLFIRPISIPPGWKLSVLNAEKAEASGQAAKAGDAPAKFPVYERDPGKHYDVRLPAKTEIKVASVVVPVGEVGANTTARWAVEGRIGDELIGGMVHEMSVPYIVADLKLPPVGSKEEEEEPPRLSGKGTAFIAIAAALMLLISIVIFVILRRRGRIPRAS